MIHFRMRLIQVCIFIDQLQGGAPCSTLGSFLALRSVGIENEIYALGEGLTSSTQSGFLPNLDPNLRNQIHWVERNNQSNHGHLLNLREMKNLFLKISGSEIVLTHQVYGLHSLYVYIFCLLTKKPYVVMPHGSLTIYDQRHHRFRKRFANFLFIRRFIASANSIFVASDVERLELSESFKAREISVVGLGFPKQFDREITVKKNPSEIKSILFMGRITEKKRLDLTIRAIAKLVQDYFPVQLIVAGDGPDEMVEKYSQLAMELGISEYVKFLGWVTGWEKQNVILSADYFVLNSEDENFAVIVPEVQSYGVPVLLSGKVAFSEYVRRYESGVVINSLEISSIVEGFERLLHMNLEILRKNAIKCAESSEWNQVIHNWVTNFTHILENSK